MEQINSMAQQLVEALKQQGLNTEGAKVVKTPHGFAVALPAYKAGLQKLLSGGVLQQEHHGHDNNVMEEITHLQDLILQLKKKNANLLERLRQGLQDRVQSEKKGTLSPLFKTEVFTRCCRFPSSVDEIQSMIDDIAVELHGAEAGAVADRRRGNVMVIGSKEEDCTKYFVALDYYVAEVPNRA